LVVPLLEMIGNHPELSLAVKAQAAELAWHSTVKPSPTGPCPHCANGASCASPSLAVDAQPLEIRYPLRPPLVVVRLLAAAFPC
jgi:hypothetical protein